MADTSTEAAVLQPNLALVLERITDGFFALNADWRIAYMKSQARRMLRVEADPIGRIWLSSSRKRAAGYSNASTAARCASRTPFNSWSTRSRRSAGSRSKRIPRSTAFRYTFATSVRTSMRSVKSNTTRGGNGDHRLRPSGARRTLLRAIGRRRARSRSRRARGADRGGVRLRSRAESFSVSAAIGWPSATAFDPAQPALGHLQHVVRTGEPFVSTDLRVDPRARTLGTLEAGGARAASAS